MRSGLGGVEVVRWDEGIECRPRGQGAGPGVGAGGLPSLDSQVTGSRAHSSHLMARSRQEWGKQTQASSSAGALPRCPHLGLGRRQPLWPWAGAQGRVLACPSRSHCLMAPPGLSGLAFSCFSGAQIPSLPWGSTPMAATPNTQASLVRRWSSLGLGAGPAWTPRGAWSRRVHPAAEACVLPRPGSLEEVRGWAAGRAGLSECLNPAGRPTSSAISHGQLPRLQSGPI